MKKRIKELRIEKGLTLKQVANHLGISEATAQRYETGSIADIKYDKVVLLANLFNCEPAYLLGYDSSPEQNISRNEQTLLDIYNNLNEEGKYELLKQARLLNSVEIYKKESDIFKEA